MAAELSPENWRYQASTCWTWQRSSRKTPRSGSNIAIGYLIRTLVFAPIQLLTWIKVVGDFCTQGDKHVDNHAHEQKWISHRVLIEPWRWCTCLKGYVSHQSSANRSKSHHCGDGYKPRKIAGDHNGNGKHANVAIGKMACRYKERCASRTSLCQDWDHPRSSENYCIVLLGTAMTTA